MTRNLVPGESVYGEKRISVPSSVVPADGSAPEKIEYRVWNPYRSKIAAAIISGVDDIFIKPGHRVLYLGAASGTTVSHVSDMVGPEGMVYAVEFSHRSGRDLITAAKKRINVVPIIEDARHSFKYRMQVPMVDVMFADVAQPDQARIFAENAALYLKAGGGAIISIKASCVDSAAEPHQVYQSEIEVLKTHGFKPKEMIDIDPYQRGHAVVNLIYRPDQA